MAQDGAYDVFLSYSWQDHAAVEPIAQALRQRGLVPFLDRWYLAPGQPWIPTLQGVLARSKAVAVLIGPRGLGSWQQREAQLALDRQAHEQGFPVLPILLPGGDPALGFLALNTWIDLRQGTKDEDLAVLELAIRGEPPGPEMTDRISATRAAICPYRGLRPFREEDAAFFRGREAFTESLLETVNRQSFVAVVGASGCGKSSVVRAGLTPKLRQQRGAGAPVWDIVTMVPGEQPLASLAAVLMPLLKPDLDIIDRRNEGNKLAGYWSAGTTRVAETVADLLQLQSGTDRLLLVVDQWEELYTLCKDDGARRRFTDELLAATERGPLTVALTLRGDFYGHAVSDRALADRLQQAVVNLGPMTADELRRAIAEPAGKIGLSFEDGLVTRILEDVGDEPGNLPLLEFVLEMLWERRRGGELHHGAYEEIGGVQGAIANRADETFAALPPAQQQVARQALIKLVRPGEGTEDTRRRALVEELGPDATSVIEKFVSARLLVTGLDRIRGDETVEVTHEALIRRWEQLRRWIDEDREFLRTRDRIESTARYWADHERDPSLLLAPGRPLAEGEEIIGKRRADLGPSVIEFIEASTAAERARQDAEREEERRHAAEKEAERQRDAAAAGRIRRTRILAALMGAVAVTLSAVGWYAYTKKIEAEDLAGRLEIENRAAMEARNAAEVAKTRAEEESEKAIKLGRELQVTQSRFLAALSRQQASLGDGVTGARLALEALPHDLSGSDASDRPYVPDAATALYFALQEVRERAVISSPEDRVLSAAFSPNGDRLVMALTDGTARLWDLRNGAESLRLDHRTGGAPVTAAAFSRKGDRVITAAGDTAVVWNASDGKEIRAFKDSSGAVLLAALSPDGSRILTVGGDNRARLFDVITGAEVVSVSGNGRLRSAAFSPDGKRLVTIADDGTAQLWDTTSAKAPTAVGTGTDGKILAVAFRPGGLRVLLMGPTVFGTSSPNLWDSDTGRYVSLSSVAGALRSATISPDGDRIVAVADDKTARIWNDMGETVAVLRGHEDALLSATFSPDEKRIVTTSTDRTARLWDAASGELIAIFPDVSEISASSRPDGQTSTEVSAEFSPDGRTVVVVVVTGKALDGPVQETTTQDRAVETGTARLWDTTPTLLRGHTGAVRSTAFSPDGTRLVTGSDDGTARVWNTVTGAVTAILRGHQAAVLSVAFNPDGKRIVTASRDGSAMIWDGSTGQLMDTKVTRRPGPVLSAGYSPDGRELLRLFEYDGAVTVDDALDSAEQSESGRAEILRDINLGARDIKSAAFSPDGKYLATCTQFEINLWSLTEKRPPRQLFAIQGWINSAAFNHDGTRVITAYEGQVQVLNVEDGAPIGRPMNVPGVQSAAFNRDDSQILTVSEDGVVRLWDAKGDELIALDPTAGRVLSAAFSPDGTHIVTAYSDGTARLWRVLPTGQALIDYAAKNLRRQLSVGQRRQFFLDAPP